MGHHHHKRNENCPHGWWATDDVDGHHHHKLGHNCEHNCWATDTVNGHHHHLRGGDCIEHNSWATGEDLPTTDPTNAVRVNFEEGEKADLAAERTPPPKSK